jgi:hypothetical protein
MNLCFQVVFSLLPEQYKLGVFKQVVDKYFTFNSVTKITLHKHCLIDHYLLKRYIPILTKKTTTLTKDNRANIHAMLPSYNEV